MSYLLAVFCVIVSVYDRLTGNVLECGQMAIAAAVFTVAGNIAYSNKVTTNSINTKENEDE